AGDVDPLAAAWTLPPPVVIRPPAPEPLRCPRLEVRPSLGRTPARRVDVAAEDEPLASVVARLARDAGLTLAVDPALDEKVTLSLRDVPPREAVEALARSARARIVDLPGGGALLVPGERVTASFSDREVHGALETIARLAGATVVVADEVRGRVTLDLHEVPWREAVEHVAGAVGAEVTHERGCTLVGPPPASPLTWTAAMRAEALWALHPHVRLDVVAEDAIPQEVAGVLGQLAGQELQAFPALSARVDLTLTDAPFGVAVDLLARTLDCAVEQWERPGEGSFLLVAPRPPDRVRARGAPAAALVEALAACAARRVEVGPYLDDLISVDLRGLCPADAPRVVAWKLGWRVEEPEEDALVISGPSPRPARPSSSDVQGEAGAPPRLPPAAPPSPAATIAELREAARRARDEMSAALKVGDLAAVRAGWPPLEDLIRRVRDRAERVEDFELTASLDLHGRDILGQVDRLEDIERRFGPLLRVTAVLLPGRFEAAVAIVGGRVLREGAGVVDPTTGEVIQGLVVTGITADGVRFLHEGYRFSCALGGGPPGR
ncbi:MAG: hypothetical protein KIT58_21915, partial [Planctomycetota bacterium]|nr:hypothetical protein [Planctomycetota bacterium]